MWSGFKHTISQFLLSSLQNVTCQYQILISVDFWQEPFVLWDLPLSCSLYWNHNSCISARKLPADVWKSSQRKTCLSFTINEFLLLCSFSFSSEFLSAEILFPVVSCASYEVTATEIRCFFLQEQQTQPKRAFAMNKEVKKNKQQAARFFEMSKKMPWSTCVLGWKSVLWPLLP